MAITDVPALNIRLATTLQPKVGVGCGNEVEYDIEALLCNPEADRQLEARTGFLATESDRPKLGQSFPWTRGQTGRVFITRFSQCSVVMLASQGLVRISLQTPSLRDRAMAYA